MRFGTLVPHFGSAAEPATLLRTAARAEALGFRSFWVRDHIIWTPHGMEGTDNTFVDPFLTLAALSAVTHDSVLGTGVVIPIRWPLKLAQNFASLSWLNGGGIVAGIGLGFDPKEFAAAGLDVEQREEIFRDSVAIMRRVWTEDGVSFAGEHFSFDDVTLSPKPVEPIPIVYGGNTPAAVRRAVQHTDGWYPGRLPLTTLERRLDYIEELVGERAADVHTIIQPLVVVAATREEAERAVPVHEVAHSSGGSKFWLPPASGSFETVDDLRGLVLCGTPDDIVEQLEDFHRLGIDEFIFDFRLQFDRYEEAIELVGSEVLPKVTHMTLKRPTATPAALPHG